ncbi:MAG: Rnf-Nqr domain containing protein [Bacilli bacterium]|nr:Rnf-Nqr domain containing protein [Bacilli bacterium]
MNLISLFIASILTSNVVLTKFLGLCPFIGASNNKKDALKMGVSVTIVLIITSIITYLLYYYVLVLLDATYLVNLLFILVIAFVVQMLEMIFKKYFLNVYHVLDIYLPLITTNCAIMGLLLININSDYNLIEAIINSFGSGLGFTLVIIVFGSIREKMENSNIPNNFKGTPIALITAGIMALLFGSYMGG